MGHRVSFENFRRVFKGLLTEADVRDCIDMFYRWGDSKFIITVVTGPKGQRGLHSWDGLARTHVINLSLPNIEKGFSLKQRMGGNTPAPSLKMAAVMVLTHELQHANQVYDHGHGDRNFYGARATGRIKYDRRPCERDARRFVDENIAVIAEFVGHKMPARTSRQPVVGNKADELQDVADVLLEAGEVSVKDIVEELRASKINNPKNVERVIAILQDNGATVSL